MTNPIPIVVIMGPTGVGKTRLSVEIAAAVDGEIISLDSIQAYRDCPIMAAQVTKEEMKQIPHHLVNHLDAAEEPSASDFVRDALEAVREIDGRGRVPIICGGSTSLTKPLLFHPFVQAQKVLPIALTADLDLIKTLCDGRIEQMVRDGLLSEVERMFKLECKMGLYDSPVRRGAWRSIGYPELRGWCDAKTAGADDKAAQALERGLQLMKQNTLRYAETQLRLLWDNIIPASPNVYGKCLVFTVVSRERFADDVEQPAVHSCKQWLHKFRQASLSAKLVAKSGSTNSVAIGV
ncbi:uncharacterized protein PpBr36_10100 [Pyricularia pennisetigena]|uniref:uncharacterized protein n=1 Tax=Pyricularia pennisetigena TaxID=1578925 RepID=UPI001151BAEB|nr:uncharacterized protein PpBr36_10100 [Pyricularia pennisetigena]TLS22353.1 hypothetical protein PpBr36_10100 [Pyricularia pennisetigena]